MARSRRRAAPLLSDVCGGRDNNLNLIRAVAASLVLVSHSFPVTQGLGAPEPLVALTGHSLGSLSVAIFFVISGFLIARSYDRRASSWHWLTARVLRLMPGLFVVLTLTAIVMGPLVTALPATQYWATPETWIYAPYNMTLYRGQYDLPGVFLTNIYGTPINGSLWTLKFEVTCYAGLYLAGVFGMLRKPALFAIGLAGFALLYIVVVPFGFGLGFGGYLHPLMLLALPFVYGMMAYVWRDRLRLDWRLVAVVWIVAVLARFTPVFTPFYLLAVGYTTLVIAYRPKGVLLHFNELGDYSYGIYIYAFPIQQLMVHLFPGQSWYMNVATAFPPTLICAILSWHFVEKGALALAKPSAERMASFWRRENPAVLPNAG